MLVSGGRIPAARLAGVPLRESMQADGCGVSAGAWFVVQFPKWLNAPETQKKLSGKKVMMYCTGGIRCERARYAAC